MPRCGLRGKIRRVLGLLVLLMGVSLPGCGYSFQHSHNPLLARYGVRKLYVAPLRNDTFKGGVENVVYNELIKVIAANRRVLLVGRREEADAVLQGTVSQAGYTRGGTTTADQLFPTAAVLPNIPRPSANTPVATEYQASLAASFTLSLVHPKPGDRAQLWDGSFSRSQVFPGNNQLDVYGTTGHLINESEFDRALRELAESVMANLHESMLAMF